MFFLHFVLEDDASYDDGNGCGEVTDESECCGCSGDIASWNHSLQCDEWRLEIRSYTYASDDLENDDFGPTMAVGEIKQETETERHHGKAEPDCGEITAGFLDENPC